MTTMVKKLYTTNNRTITQNNDAAGRVSFRLSKIAFLVTSFMVCSVVVRTFPFRSSRVKILQQQQQHQQGTTKEPKLIQMEPKNELLAAPRSSTTAPIQVPNTITSITTTDTDTSADSTITTDTSIDSTTTTAATSSSSSSSFITTATTNQHDDVIAWLTMGPAKNYPAIRDRFQPLGDKVVLYYHSFDEPCEGCIFQRGTSYAEGRHLLLKSAMKYPRVKYFVIFDDDMELFCGESLRQIALPAAIQQGRTLPSDFPPGTKLHCWESFTDMLLEKSTNYPFVKPLLEAVDLGDAFTVKYQSCNDENFKGFHRDYLWFFYPSTTYKEQISWWFNGRSKMYLSQRCFPFAWKVDGNWGAKNDVHRDYPKDESFEHTPDVLEYTYPQLGPWDISKYKCCHRCEIRDEPPNVDTDLDPHCKSVLQERFQKWVNGTFELELVKHDH